MNKYLKKINPQDLVGRKIYSDEGEEYIIEFASLEEKKNGLFIVFANEKDAQKDENHKQGLRSLKEELERQHVNFNEDYGYIWKIRYSTITVHNPLLNNGDGEKSYNFYTRSDNDSFDMLMREEVDGSIKSAEQIRKAVEGKTGLIGGLRTIFKELLGEEYATELKSHFVEVAKRNIREDMNYHKSEIAALQRTLTQLRQREKEVYAEEGRTLFEDNSDEESLGSIDDGLENE